VRRAFNERLRISRRRQNQNERSNHALLCSGLFIAVVAALFGFGGIAAGAVEIAKVLFFIFLVLFAVSLIAGLLRRSG
jgi:uncharacterized membrane protein YtjA (UPF0391 family)